MSGFSNFEEIFSKYPSDDFNRELDSAFDLVHPDSGSEFFSYLGGSVSKVEDSELKNLVLRHCYLLLQKDFQFTESFVKSSIFKKSKLLDPSTALNYVQIYSLVIDQQIIPPPEKGCKAIVKFSETIPDIALHLFSKVALNFPNDVSLSHIFLSLFSFLQIEKQIKEFAEIVYFLGKVNEFASSHQEFISNFVQRLARDPNTGVIQIAYFMAINLGLNVINFRTVEKHLLNKDLAQCTIDYLATLSEIPFSKRLVSNIIWTLKTVPNAQYILCSIIQERIPGVFLLEMENLEWASNELPNSAVIRFILVICGHSAKLIGANPKIVTILSRICLAANAIETTALCGIADLIGSEISNLGVLTSTGFLSNLIRKVFSFEGQENYRALILALDHLARVGYSEAFLEAIPHLHSLFETNLFGRAFSLAVVFAYLPQMRTSLYEKGIVEKISKMSLTPELEAYRQYFMQQIYQQST